ncbi:MAG: P27 family phage terminase small subunit [Acidimicrobiales bacterium]
MPARKKPTSTLAPRSRRPELAVIAGCSTPPPELFWAPEIARDWEALWATELAAYFAPTDETALRRLFDLYDERAALLAVCRAERFVAGSMGQPVLNPAHQAVASLDGRILVLEDRLGLNPAARMKLGIQFGAAAKSLADLNNLAGGKPAPKRAEPTEVIDVVSADPRFAG